MHIIHTIRYRFSNGSEYVQVISAVHKNKFIDVMNVLEVEYFVGVDVFFSIFYLSSVQLVNDNVAPKIDAHRV